MLEEVARKQREAEEARAEILRRAPAGAAPAPLPAPPRTPDSG
jgi:hypothetical protein